MNRRLLAFVAPGAGGYDDVADAGRRVVVLHRDLSMSSLSAHRPMATGGSVGRTFCCPRVPRPESAAPSICPRRRRIVEVVALRHNRKIWTLFTWREVMWERDRRLHSEPSPL
jgi:hypothetical protein